MEHYQISDTIVPVIVVSMMPFEVLLALDHLPTDGTASVLSLQYTCTRRRRRFEHQLSVSVLEVAHPFTVERVSLGFDLDMTLGRDRLLETDNALADGLDPGLERLHRGIRVAPQVAIGPEVAVGAHDVRVAFRALVDRPP